MGLVGRSTRMRSTISKGLLQILRGRLSEGIRYYNIATSKAPNNEIKNLVRQKKNIELARYYLNAGKREEALRYLHSTLSIQTKARLFLNQANKMKEQIEELPEQGKLSFPASPPVDGK